MKILRSTHTVNPALGGPIESIRQSSAAPDSARSHGRDRFARCACRSLGARARCRSMRSGRAAAVTDTRPVFRAGSGNARPEYDAVIVHGIWQYNSFGVWRALAGTATPYFVFPHGMLDPWFKRTYPLKHMKKLLYWPWGEYRVLRDAAAVLFTSEEERQLARESFSLYQLQRSRRELRHGGARDRSRSRARGIFRSVSETSRPALLSFSWAAPREERLRPDHRSICRRAKFLRTGSQMHLVLAGPCADEEYLRRLQRSGRGGDKR